MAQRSLPSDEEASVAVGLSLKSGTCTVAVDLSHLGSEISSNHRLQRGHSIVAVDGHLVDASTVGKYLRDGPVGSLARIRARDETNCEFDMVLQRQFGPFGKIFLILPYLILFKYSKTYCSDNCSTVENLAKVQDLLAIIDKDFANGNSRPAAALSTIRTRHTVLRAHIRGMALAAADFEQRARRRIDRLDSIIHELQQASFSNMRSRRIVS